MARERINAATATEAIVMQSMLRAVWNGGESHRQFNDLLKRLQGD